jgi:hypothetical protein
MILLTPRFQTELGITHVTDRDIANHSTIVSDAHTNTNNVVPDVRHNVSNTHVMVSDIRRSTLKSREDTDNQNLVVSIACTLRVTEVTSLRCLDSCQVSSLNCK